MSDDRLIAGSGGTTWFRFSKGGHHFDIHADGHAAGTTVKYYLSGNIPSAQQIEGGTLTATYLAKTSVDQNNLGNLQWHGNTGEPLPPKFSEAQAALAANAQRRDVDQNGNGDGHHPSVQTHNTGLVQGDNLPHNNTNNVWIVSDAAGNYVLMPVNFCLMGSPNGTTYSFEASSGQSPANNVAHNNASHTAVSPGFTRLQ